MSLALDAAYRQLAPMVYKRLQRLLGLTIGARGDVMAAVIDDPPKGVDPSCLITEALAWRFELPEHTPTTIAKLPISP